MMDMLEFKSRCNKRLQAMKSERASFDSHWQTIAKVTAPRSSRFLSTDRNKGDRRTSDIYNNTAPFAVRTLASGMMAGMTSPARPWFKLSIGNAKLRELQSVKEWLYEVESSMRAVLNSSNAYDSLSTVFQQIGCFGTAVNVVLEDDKDVIRCYALPVGSYYISTDGTGRVNALYREYSMTVGQLVEMFGIDNVSLEVKTSYESKNIDTWIEVVHVIQANTERDSAMLDNKNKAFISCRFEKASAGTNDKCLDISGYDEFPVQAPRWETAGEDIYGSSCPGMIALPDILMLNKTVKLYDKIANKIADPPLIADAMVRNQQISMLPGAVTYISGLATAAGAGVRPMQEISPTTLQPIAEKISVLQQAVNQAFFADMMQMFATSDISNMTAREVEERHQEKLLILGPVMERLNGELLDPLIQRTYAIMERKGLIPPPAQEMHGQPLNIEYVSVMASAQKMIGTPAIERLLGMVGNIAAIRPEIVDKIDFDHAVDEMSNMLGTSPKVVISDDEVKKIRSIRAEAQAKQQQAEQIAQMAPALQQGADAARLLSETGVGDSTALNRMLGI